MFELLFAHPFWAYSAGKITLAGAWPRWVLFVAIAFVCIAIGVTLWRRRHLGTMRLIALGVLQATLATLILCLLWRPVLNVERVRDRQNVLAVVVDNSASMMQNDATEGKTERDAPSRLSLAIQALKSGPLEQLQKTFELRFFAFDKTAAPIVNLDALPEAGNQSRIGDALRNVMQTAGSVPLAGVVLVSDGAETGHSLSEANLRELAAFGVPVHTVGVGPERADNDLELASVEAPTQAVPNTTATAEVNIQFTQAATTRLRIYDGDVLLAARELKLQPQAGRESGPGYVNTVRVEFPSGAPGVRDLRFT
ncbi:MAG TPA: vWA domain-containing protein, partial [Steroidobacteraceae bacterium]|nr:vWA domain-containing protein [Steroidobacteraceae bacterium]